VKMSSTEAWRLTAASLNRGTATSTGAIADVAITLAPTRVAAAAGRERRAAIT